MANDPAGNDPRAIWQNQPTEPSTMAPEMIRQKVRELHAKTRQELLRGLALPFLIAGLFGTASAYIDGLAMRVLLALSLGWSLAGQYLINRGMWSATTGESASSTGLQSYRREVERRRSLSNYFLLWSLGPVLLAVAAFTAPLVRLGIEKGLLRNMIPFLTLLSIWMVCVFVIRIRAQRELQREIERLNEIESAA